MWLNQKNPVAYAERREANNYSIWVKDETGEYVKVSSVEGRKNAGEIVQLLTTARDTDRFNVTRRANAERTKRLSR